MVFGRNHKREVDAEKAAVGGPTSHTAGVSPTGTMTTGVHDEKLPRKPLYLSTRTLTSHVFFGAHIWIPMAAAFVWLATLLALLGLWVRDGKPQYQADEGSVVVYISDVAGASRSWLRNGTPGI